MHANVGDTIVVDSVRVGTPPRNGTILEVRGDDEDQEHYLVRWSNGQESIYFPGSTTHTIQPSHRVRN